MRVRTAKQRAVVALATTLLACHLPWASAQTTVIENATLLIGDGRSLDEGSLVMSQGKITDLGRQVRAGGGLFSRPKKIDASGKYVTPGLIDVWSSPSLNPPSVGQPQGRAADLVDRFDEDWMARAHAAGVTTLYVPARTQGGFGGLGTVVRLVPKGSPEEVFLDDRASLCAAMTGGNGIQRSKNYTAFSDSFREAKEYRESLETYEEDLEEYEKELKKWIEKREKEKDKDKEDDKKDEAKKGDGKGDKTMADDPRPRRRRRPGGAPSSDGKPAEKKDGDKKEEDGPKKPEKPARDAGKDVLLEALDGELVWRVEASRVADLASTIEIAERYGLALVIEGASGAPWLADELAEHDIPVVLGAGGTPVRGAGRDQHPQALQKLAEAGVEVYIASGPTMATAQLPLRAASAVAAGLDESDVLKRLMADAARLLGVSEEVGRLGRGMNADVVIWSDHPFAPGAKVERVFVGGKEVYVAEQE